MVIQEKKASWEIKVMRYDNPREKASWKIKVIKYYFSNNTFDCIDTGI